MVYLIIVFTKLWIDVQQGEDADVFLIFLLHEESCEAGHVVEQEWSQHRCGHLWVITPGTIIIICGSSVQFVDEIDVRQSVQGWEDEVENNQDQD